MHPKTQSWLLSERSVMTDTFVEATKPSDWKFRKLLLLLGNKKRMISVSQKRVSKLVLFCSIYTLAAVNALSQDAPMAPQEIQATWVGKTVVASISSGPISGKIIELVLRADGTAEVSGAIADSGVWRISSAGYCATWKKIRAGQERCFTVVRKGNEQHVINPDGTTNSVVTQVR